MLFENDTIDSYAYQPCYRPGRIYIARGPWHFGDFRNIFLPKVGKDQKKISPSKRGAPSQVLRHILVNPALVIGLRS